MKSSITSTFLSVFTAVALAGCGGSGGGGDQGDEDGYIRITSPTTAASYKADMPFPDIYVGGTIERPAPSEQSSGGGGGGGSSPSLSCLIVWPCFILTSLFFKTSDNAPVAAAKAASSATANIASGSVTIKVFNETIEASAEWQTTDDTWASTIPVTLGENLITVNAIDESGYSSSDRIVVDISAPRYKLPTLDINPHGFQTSEYYLSPHDIEVHSNSRGDSIIAWNDGSTYEVDAARLVAAVYHPNSGWSSTTVITDSPVYFRIRPRVSMDGAGNAMVVWHQDDAIHYRRYTPATGWSAAIRLFDAVLYTNQGYDFSLLTDWQGNAYLFWHDHDNGYSGPQYYARYDALNGWSAPILHTESLYTHLGAEYTIDANGIVSAIWRYNEEIYFSRLTAETGWLTPQQIASQVSRVADMRIEVSDSGNIVAIWANRAEDNDDEYHISANVFHPASGWNGVTSIAAGSLGTDFELSAGIEANGHIVAVWPEYLDDYDTIMAVEYRHADGWGNPYPISRAQTGDARGPAMVMLESGQALITWAQFDGWIESIVALEFDPQSGWGQTELIELNMAAGSRNPVIGTASDNAILIAWEQYTDVWYQTPSTDSVQVGSYPLLN